MPQVLQETTGQASTGSYATLLKAKIIGRPKASLTVHNTGPYNIKWKVMVSNDRTGSSTSFGEEKSESTLASGASDCYAVSGCFAWVDIQIVDATAPNHGTCSAYLYATGI